MNFHDEGLFQGGHGDINNKGTVGHNATVNNYAVGQTPVRSGVDVAVMTALPKELAAVVRILVHSPSYECIVGEGERPVHRADVITGGGPITVVATVNASAGNRSAVAGFEFLRRQFAPAVIVMLGIAGGIHRDLHIGDVVIGDEVVYYDLRKKMSEGGVRRGTSHPVPAIARNMINAFLTEAGDPAVVMGDDGPFRVFAGPIGSGESVVAAGDSPVRAFLTGFNDRTLALEMESGGAAQAHFETAGLNPRVHAWFPIRGISDLASAGKNDDHQVVAARHAAAVFERMLPHLRVSSH
jgi:adenosylhomocysteine nucleosidase